MSRKLRRGDPGTRTDVERPYTAAGQQVVEHRLGVTRAVPVIGTRGGAERIGSVALQMQIGRIRHRQFLGLTHPLTVPRRNVAPR